MKYFLPLAVVLFLLTGCDTSRVQELEKSNAELRRQQDSTSQDLAAQQQYVTEITNSINNVYDNMQRISEGEQMLSKSTTELEMGTRATTAPVRDRIVRQLAGIDTYIAENRKKLDDLDAKLKTSKSQYAGLKKMVDNLKEQLAEKERSIAALQENLKMLNVQMASLHDTVSRKEYVISSQKREMNSAYYAAGNRSDLETKGLINDEGGFPFGWFGSTSVLASGVNRHEFVPIDRYEQTLISIDGEVDEIIPKRNENYYAINETEGSTVIQVLDPDKFWQEKYLVIVTK